MASLEDEDEKKKVGAEKMSFVLQELVGTEKEYVEKMNDLIKVGMDSHVMQISHTGILHCRIFYQKCHLQNCLSVCSTKSESSLGMLKICMHSIASENP